MAVAPSSPLAQALRQGLRDHGLVEGKNLSVEHRFANGDPKQMARLAAELILLKMDVIVTESFQAALAVKQASATIPIVTAVIADPVKLNLAASYRRPGGNLTGLTIAGADRTSKQLQLLQELLPRLSSVAVIHNPTHPDAAEDLREARISAEALRITLHFVGVRSPTEFAGAFSDITKLAPSGLISIGDGMLLNHARLIGEFVTRQRLPGAFPEREYAANGGLMAYGPSLKANFLRAADFVDKILNGAKPGELPIERPSKFDLVINLTTAKALGLKIPPSILVRADEVIH
jgi:putative ABC transport system substrate-binding protein